MMYEAGLEPVHISMLATALQGLAREELAYVGEMGSLDAGAAAWKRI